MKFKLHFKILVILIIAISCFVASLIFSIFVINHKFENIILQNEVIEAGFLADSLAIYYSENGGWGSLIKNFGLWTELLERGLSKDNYNLDNLAKAKPTNNNDFVIRIIYQPSGFPIPSWDPLNIGPRVCLFDEHKKYIIGQHILSIEECSLLRIESEGKTIGWLGLIKSRKIYQPLDQAISQNQSSLFYITGVAFLLILISVTFLFSKYMLMPITRLAAATKKLGPLNFNIRVPVESSDELGELASHFNDMAQKLEDYEQNQKQWLTDVSHELRTPLSVLICEIDALKDGIRKPNKALLVSLSQEMRRLIKLVNDLNDISLIETGALPVKKKSIKPLPLVSQEIFIFKKRFEDNGISIEVELDPSAADIYIIGDSNRLKQLFSNIFENAIRYVKKPGRLIIRQTINAKHIKFIFEDSGPGVPDEALPFLFNRLYRSDASRSRKTGGSGLGLAICKSIIEMHNGKIRAQNVQGSGLMIEILLPLEHNSGDLTDKQSDAA